MLTMSSRFMSKSPVAARLLQLLVIQIVKGTKDEARGAPATTRERRCAMTLHRFFPLTMLAVASAAFLFNSAPAEAACPSGYFQCIRGGKAHSPKRCCPIARPAATPALPLSRCKSAVRQVGPNGSVKIRCTRWSTLPGAPRVPSWQRDIPNEGGVHGNSNIVSL
jgi:hypothetical protein